MGSTTARTIEPRDAAITAAIAGAVLVVLGYASGIGVRPASQVTATMPEQAAPPAATAPLSPAPAPIVAAEPPAAAPVPVLVPAAPATVASPPPTTQPAMEMPTPTDAPVAAPAPAADPADPATCSPGLVESLLGNVPLVSDVTSGVTTLLSGLTSGLLSSPAEGAPCDAAAARPTAGATP